MAPEAGPAPTAAPAAGPAKKGNIFTRKIGPLPMWVWLTIGIAIVVGFALYKSRTSSSGAGSQADQSATGTDASQIPQFVNQTYTTVTPPTPPAPVSATGGTPTSTGPQPSPVPSRPPLKPDTRWTEAVGQGGITLGTFARRHHWTSAELKQVESLNKMTSRTRLKKGQRLLAPA